MSTYTLKSLLPGRAVDRRYGITSRTRARWRKSTDLQFAVPVIINGREYYAEQDLEAFDERMRTQVTQAKRSK